MGPLSPWENFYVIVGSAGAALIGVQFVVVALVANFRRPTTAEAVAAFGTPTVVHLGSALVISAIMSAPWPSLFAVSIALALCGLAGLTYGAIVIRRAHRQTAYQPVWEDWLWHAILPCSVYATFTVAAVIVPARTVLALFSVGGASLVLLLIGIHNAWDTVTYLVAQAHAEETKAAAAKTAQDPSVPNP
jgi:hypothetical protein